MYKSHFTPNKNNGYSPYNPYRGHYNQNHHHKIAAATPLEHAEKVVTELEALADEYDDLVVDALQDPDADYTTEMRHAVDALRQINAAFGRQLPLLRADNIPTADLAARRRAAAARVTEAVDELQTAISFSDFNARRECAR